MAGAQGCCQAFPGCVLRRGHVMSPEDSSITSGTGMCCQCPLLTHSLSHSANGIFPSGPGSSSTDVSQDLGAIPRNWS